MRRTVSVFGSAGLFLLCMVSEGGAILSEPKPRARELGIEIGIFSPGPVNAITDVAGVAVGQTTVWEGDNVRTGVTIIFPHDGNIFQDKVPAGVYVGNGFGKLCGISQIEELGTIETPIALTNTLNVPTVADALIDYVLRLPGNEQVRSVNPVVGETKDGWLIEIRKRSDTKEHGIDAIARASRGIVKEGTAGAGTGTKCMGFKGGIGTSSRVLPRSMGAYTVGVLVQKNFGGVLTVNGAPVGRELGVFSYSKKRSTDESGSCMIIVATDAPVRPHDLTRIAKRAVFAMARVGAAFSNGSGDYAICFSTQREKENRQTKLLESSRVGGRDLSPIFFAVQEATEEAIINSMLTAETVIGFEGHEVKALPQDEVVEICRKYNALGWAQKLPGAESVE